MKKLLMLILAISSFSCLHANYDLIRFENLTGQLALAVMYRRVINIVTGEMLDPDDIELITTHIISGSYIQKTTIKPDFNDKEFRNIFLTVSCGESAKSFSLKELQGKRIVLKRKSSNFLSDLFANDNRADKQIIISLADAKRIEL